MSHLMIPLNPPTSVTRTLLPLSLAILGLAASPVNAEQSLIEQIQQGTTSIVAVQAQRVQTNGSALQVQEQSGAGVIIDPSGYIVTNTHTILYADYVHVTLNDGTKVPAKIVAIAPNTDFSILKIDPHVELKALPWADPGHIALDTEIISIGNTPLWKETICGGRITGLANNLSTGMVGLIQMNLALDRGDSGGPILDREGRFLGIIVAKDTKVERSSFALPAWEIRQFFLNHLKNDANTHAQ